MASAVLLPKSALLGRTWDPLATVPRRVGQRRAGPLVPPVHSVPPTVSLREVINRTMDSGFCSHPNTTPAQKAW
jgi:hypothetical protein